jgi:hypothetical protein
VLLARQARAKVRLVSRKMLGKSSGLSESTRIRGSANQSLLKPWLFWQATAARVTHDQADAPRPLIDAESCNAAGDPGNFG